MPTRDMNDTYLHDFSLQKMCKNVILQKVTKKDAVYDLCLPEGVQHFIFSESGCEKIVFEFDLQRQKDVECQTDAYIYVPHKVVSNHG